MPGTVAIPDLRAEIEAAVASGKTFNEIDDQILASERDLDQEERDALWLYAWGCSEKAEQGLFMPHPAAVDAEHD
jgi:hypothetical protein